MNMTYKEILPGVKLRVIESRRFETSCISVQFLSRISDETASKMTLVPRVLRRGTTKHPDMESLAAALDDMYGARIEPISRKYGDIMTGGFVCDFVDMDENLLPGVTKLIGEVLFDPKTDNGAFVNEYVDGERANLIDEIKSEINSKMTYALKKATEEMFKNSAYAVDELGTEEAAESVDSRSLYRYYKKMIAEAPCEIFFCGKYSYEEVEREMLRMFKLCPRGKTVCVKSEDARHAKDIRQTERLDIVQASLVIGMYTDEKDVYVSKLLTTVIGGGTTSKLFTNVREKASLCYSVGAMFDSCQKAMFMYAGIDPKNAGVAEKAILKEFEHCVHGDITDEEIANAKKGMIDGFLTTEDSLYSMEAYWLRAAIVGDERAPLEVAAVIKNIDADRLISAAKNFKMSVIYLLTGLEGAKNERKLLPDA